MTNEDMGYPSEPYVQFQIPGYPYSVIRFPLNADWIPTAIDVATTLAAALDVAFPQRDTPAPMPAGTGSVAPQRPQQTPQGGQQTRASQYPRVTGECDTCGGPVGRYPRKGNMQSDKAVCLGKCKDGQYVHTAFWLNSEPELEYMEADPF